MTARPVVVMAAAALAVAACRDKPTAGRPCRVIDQLVCAGAGRALLCEPSRGPEGAQSPKTEWIDVPCKGARGCARRGEADDCDDTVAAEGDACPRDPPLDYACTADKSRAVVCKEGTFALWRACRGPEGCALEGARSVKCDTTLGAPGDPCGQAGTFACAADGKAILACDGTTLTASSSCRGPQGCRIDRDTHKVDCDDSLAEEGDACDQPKRIACSGDRKAELVCQGAKYVKKRECRRSDCRLDGSELFCD
ncbi:MAG TPA: hypothetical protein VGG39_15065 [Polyangiaceae bacterium]